MTSSVQSRQRRARLAVSLWLAVAAGLTVVAVVTAGSPGGSAPAAPATGNVAVTSPAVAVGAAGLSPSVQPPPAPVGAAAR